MITTDEMSGTASAPQPGKANSCHNVNDNKPKGINNLIEGELSEFRLMLAFLESKRTNPNVTLPQSRSWRMPQRRRSARDTAKVNTPQENMCRDWKTYKSYQIQPVLDDGEQH